MLSIVILSVSYVVSFMLSVTFKPSMLSNILLSVVILSVVMLSVEAP
jgi:hypothetical protein